MAHHEPQRASPHLEFAATGAGTMERFRLLEDQSERNPKDAETRYQIADLYRKYDTPNLAIAWARSVLLLDPKHAGAQKLIHDLAPDKTSD
jgi:hypothetical protein